MNTAGSAHQRPTQSDEPIAAMLQSFSFAHFIITFEAIGTLELSDFKGSAFRGCFGHALRKVCCKENRADCAGCGHQDSCIYTYVFETHRLPAHAGLPFGYDAPHPYILRGPEGTKRTFHKTEFINFELILVGQAIDYIAYFAFAFIYMGEQGLGRGRGKMRLIKIESAGLPGTPPVSIYYGGEDGFRSEPVKISGSDVAALCVPHDRITMRFFSRLEIRDLQLPVSFCVLFRSLLRRIKLLAYLHCNADCLCTEFKMLQQQAGHVKTLESRLTWHSSQRYSARQKRKVPLGGFAGEVSFYGHMAPFWPLLSLGQWIHIGKKTSFGFGRYILEPCSLPETGMHN